MDEKTLRPFELSDDITLRPGQQATAGNRNPNREIASWKVLEKLQERTICDVFSVVDSRDVHAVLKLYKEKYLRQEAVTAVARLKDNRLLPVLENGSWHGCEYEVTPYLESSLDGEILNHDLLIETVIPQLTHAIEVLHINGFLHNDIKPANMFWLTRGNALVLGDYDNVCRIENKKEENLGVTTEYAAPEVLVAGPGAFSREADICSMGITLISLLTGVSPLHDKTDAQKRRMWMRGINIPENIPAHLKILINGMVQYDPEKRITLDGIHRWMRNYHIISDDSPVSVPSEAITTEQQIIPLRFGDRLITNINDMVDSCGSDWQMGCFLLKQKRLSIFLRQFDLDLFQLCSQCEKAFDQNEGLFTLIHSIRKKTDFYWYGEKYEDLEDFSVKMLESSDPEKNTQGAQFIRLNLMDVYQKILGKDDRPSDLYHDLSNVAKRDPELALTKLLTSLSMIPEFRWRDKVFSRLEDLIEWILYFSSSMDDDIENLYRSRRFEAWLDCIGKAQFLKAIQEDMKMRAV